MLKAISSTTNALGALNYKGTWNASTNTPTLTSSVGAKGDYYVVSFAGSTTLNGISNWGIGDLATFNGAVWQRVEGGADGNFVNLSVSGTSTLSNLTASTALALDASKNVVSVTNTGTGSNVLATAPTLVGNVSLSTGNLVIGTSGKGIDFSITSHPAGMTSELLADYEEGTWTMGITFGGGSTGITYTVNTGRYIKIGKSVAVTGFLLLSSKGVSAGAAVLTGLPYTIGAGNPSQSAAAVRIGITTFVGQYQAVGTIGTTTVALGADSELGVGSNLANTNFANNSLIQISYTYFVD